MTYQEILDVVNNSHACGLPAHVIDVRRLADYVQRLEEERRMLAKAYDDLSASRSRPNIQLLMRIKRGDFS
jgi:hypothetical protein